MKVSHNWLLDYVDHGLSAADVADRLTMSGLEVEEVETVGTTLDGVVVGHVLETASHPDADRLTLCQVDLGEAQVQIVCGAPNVAAGQKVPVATVGTTLMLPDRKDPDTLVPVKLKKAKLRGQASHGMICAEDELGLGEGHDGILVLDADAAVGTPMAEYLRARGVTLQDAVFDVAITPNRPDAVSHLGMARDLAALTEQPLRRPDVPALGDTGQAPVEVVLEAPEACPRYVALAVRGVEVGPSPDWLQQRLLRVGLRPINNIVDVTNYVMYECGQPLHAFDLTQIAGGRIVVRAARDEERFTTLDDVERTMPPGAVMICDAERAVAIGGVMGGQNSEVSDATQDVLIESAWFDPSTIRRTAKQLGLHTDAAYRFERGVDREAQAWAARRAAQLMIEVAGGRVEDALVDAQAAPFAPREVTLRLARIDALLGGAIPREAVERLLAAIGFGLEADGDGVLRCTVPSWRPDVEREVDVIEEVGRLWGFDRLPEPTHTRVPQFAPRTRTIDRARDRAVRVIVGQGYREIYTNSLLRHDVAEAFCQPVLNPAAALARARVADTLNPNSQELATLRPSLLPGALTVLGHNHNHGQRGQACFEFGHVFVRSDAAEGVVPGYAEHESLLLVRTGTVGAAGWDGEARQADFFDVKGTVEALLEGLGLPDARMTPRYEPTAVTLVDIEIAAGRHRLGTIGQVLPVQADAYGLAEHPVVFAELDWDALVAASAAHLEAAYTPVSRFPIVERDLAVVVREETGAGDVLTTIRQTGRPLLRDAELFDVYQGAGVEEGHKSLAVALRFGADRTLTDKEVEKAFGRITQRLEREHEARLRA